MGSKIDKTCSFVDGRIIVQQEKKSREQNAAGRTVECASGGHPVFIYKSLHLLFFPLVRILCALALGVEKNISTCSRWGPLEFQFLRPRRCLTNPFRTLLLCLGAISKSPGFISRNNFVKKLLSVLAIAIMSWQDVAQFSLCSGFKE